MIRPAVTSLILVAVAVALIFRAGAAPSAPTTIPHQSSQTITVLCAAGLSPVMAELTGAFESAPECDVSVDVSYKGSAQLIALHRIAQSGDLLIAADTFYHQTLIDQGLCSPAVVIANQTPCLIISDAATPPRSLDDALTSGKFRTSIPKSNHAAIGRLVASIEGPQRYEAFTQQSTVSRETVSQVASDIDQGIADVGIGWNTSALQFANTKSWDVEAWQPHRSSIGVSILSSSQNEAAAKTFQKFLLGESAKHILKKHGYAVDDLDTVEATP